MTPARKQELDAALKLLSSTPTIDPVSRAIVGVCAELLAEVGPSKHAQAVAQLDHFHAKLGPVANDDDGLTAKEVNARTEER